jgi:hypothetical protein
MLSFKNKQKRGITKKNKKYIFSKESLKSSDGMLVTIWGPPVWLFLHTMSFNYPINPTHEDKIHYMEFIKNLQYVLPCKHCRTNLIKNLKTNPITLEKMKNRDTFSRYLFSLHEQINKMLNKSSGLTYEDVRERYEWFRARCQPNVPVLTKTKKHKGCTEPLYGKKGKCVLRIVPQEEKIDTFEIKKECMKSK